MDDDVQRRLVDAAHATARSGLVDAFGHLSERTASGSFTITPPTPLGRLTAEGPFTPIDLDSAELPPAAPKEAWIHRALYAARPEVGAICRAQPPQLAAFAALAIDLPALNGHAAMLGRVAVHDDSRLVRHAAGGDAVARAAGAADAIVAPGDDDGGDPAAVVPADAIILRGNGAVTLGRDLPEAVARMWLLERSAELALRALAAGMPHPLPDDEQAWWRERSAELLPRIYTHLAGR